MTPFESVVAEHGATVLRVCRAVAGPDHADDAWSETFLAAMTAYPDLPADANVQAWLVTIARRKAIDTHRTRARSRTHPTDRLPERPTREGQPGGWERDLWEALGDLPPTQQAAVVYHHIAGLPYTEVAALLESNPAAARRAASDGIARLRRTYAKEMAR
ncbi:RNA polymerase sigma factor [Ruania halotolerans]|uniref:RNA polymerase sigma factor n=1 Tax=Ruania halotolerans TaxID=2897773 RepID=UPI001E5E5835|nr:sigma-70 family RNA polymerase sigma factor [Ruania halotolerans]UFU06390.1 sigma-70 family RNA polymerase sigma factor [Ruania halotolerans]